MILMIDNYDSFTYNIVQYCLELGANLKVIRNDEMSIEEIKKLNPEKIIISPGPSTPKEAGVSVEVVKKIQKPILGVCLGHQSIAYAFGGEIIRAKNLMHGKTSNIEVTLKDDIYKNLPNKFRVTRYHSLIVNKKNLPKNIIPTSFSIDDEEIMSLRVKDKPIYGVQFHPESIMSEYGKEIINNFLKL
ncbi:aminodeoxychorismate/anthranilate synthase component II [Caminibacter mediatlanticus TB-2]|uniref:ANTHRANILATE SYNTHASE COMPONENT II n=1 Tax=Caminibacter mediatlanticus TB-2 TaxID=391592 RepID=A0AAI9AGA1_9BACT|nr:aminodeoxychorismate/anthranilate synthase component II [Caminibacter mediatlanticus]EDM23097.1 ANTHRANILATE SYNTHASE COMPONENT II [Caminibacter mediatlanticus TB-2]QCT94542.1 aminodeoxychorismate/anthranilate synthase component II [Caminibacter mediatlanticus TB-2]